MPETRKMKFMSGEIKYLLGILLLETARIVHKETKNGLF